MSPDLELALELADAADAIALGRFRAHDLAVETKPDLTPVTEADRAVEERLRELIGRARPGDAVFGEELGRSGESPRRWIVDPIDGTRNYSRGIPVWATLIALEEHGELRLGVVSAPALGRRWWAERGGGAFADGDAIRVSAVERIEDAVLSLQLEIAPPELVARCWHARSFGDFWSHMLVAEAGADGCIDALGVKLWDMAAVQVVVEEAGGRFSDAEGIARPDGGAGISSNGLVHDELLAGLRTARGPTRGQSPKGSVPD
jgi:histidinol-phosphatase